MDSPVDLIISPIGELVTAHSDDGPVHGQKMSQVRRIRDAAVAVRDGKIVAVGTADEVGRQITKSKHTVEINAAKKMVVPGLIDPHTHLVFAGNRANEFIMRCQGRSYADIANAGGGIKASVIPTCQASVEELIDLALKRLARMLSCGTTTCEVKTGYALNSEAELRMLEAIVKLSSLQPVELIPTFMPAHAFPAGVKKEEYLRQILEEMLPAVPALMQKFAPEKSLPFNDVFCDEGYFSLDETKQILSTGMKHGLRPKVHADEFVNLGASKLAIELGAASADHLLKIKSNEIELMAKSNTVAVLLPGTSFFLGLNAHAPAREMIEKNVAVALGTDFNPGSCHIFSLPFIWGLACLYLKMTPEEALTAMTINSAYAIGVGDRLGQIKNGFEADIVIFDVQKLEEIPYNLGANMVDKTFKKGRLVYQTSDK